MIGHRSSLSVARALPSRREAAGDAVTRHGPVHRLGGTLAGLGAVAVSAVRCVSRWLSGVLPEVVLYEVA